MRPVAIALVTSCAVALATAAGAAELAVSSTIDSVTVYPDGAAVTRVIKVELPPGDSVLFARDFPPTLDPATLRVEGEGQSLHAADVSSLDQLFRRQVQPPVSGLV